MNSAEHPQEKYADYIVPDPLPHVESRYPVAPGREYRVIAGVSMGGFVAVLLSFHHPETFAFATGHRPALDVPTRAFSVKRMGQWLDHRSIFGPSNGPVQASEDPYTLAKTLDPAVAPYVFFTCGDREGLLPANQKFSRELKDRHFVYEFHIVENAGHDWRQWNEQVPAMMQALSSRVR